MLARAHHGSVSKEQRALIEEDLKAGRLPAVVATSSLELGIDMGAVDLVVQVESPPSVASGLQRVGRAGHQVGAVSRGVLFPKFRGDLVQTAVVVERMRSGAIEALRLPANPLDVLAQQVVAMCAMDDWAVDDLAALVARAAPFATLTRRCWRPCSTCWPAATRARSSPSCARGSSGTGTRDLLTGRPGAQRLAVTSGGTIPDRGLFGVFLATGEGPGRRVGELDEEMVYESRVSDVFTLGSSSWRIEDITHDRVLVTPAPGQPGKLPFWHGDALGRPAELGRAVGAFVREVGALEPAAARGAGAARPVWTSGPPTTCSTTWASSARPAGTCRTTGPSSSSGSATSSATGASWCTHRSAPRCTRPGRSRSARGCSERFGVDVQAMHGDDGLVLRLPDVELDEGPPLDVAALVTFDADDVHDLMTEQIGGSALFASRFRECAGRALLLPRRRPGQRQPLWQQRQRSAQLLQVASGYPDFPIVLETVRECIQDVFDVPGLAELMRDIAARKIQVVEIESAQPSPFARSLMFGYVAQFLYEGDSPLAERRAAALALDPTLLSELLGRGEGAALRDLLDPAAVQRTELELQHLTPERAARHAEDVTDLLRVLGPLSTAEVAARARPADEPDGRRLAGVTGGRPPADQGPDRRRATLGGRRGRRAAARRARGAAAGRHRRGFHGPGDRPARRAGLALRPNARPVHGGRGGRAVRPRDGGREHGHHPPGAGRPAGRGRAAAQRPGARALRRRGAALAASPLAGRAAPAGRTRAGPRPGALPAAVAGTWPGGTAAAPRACSARSSSSTAPCCPPAHWRRWSCRTGSAGYTPALLDELTSSGEVLWCGRGALPGDDGWVSLHLADTAPLTLPEPGELELSPVHQAVLDALSSGGAFFFRALSEAVGLHRRRRARRGAVGPDLVVAGHRRHAGAVAGQAVRRADGAPRGAHGSAPQQVRRTGRLAVRVRPGCGGAPAGDAEPLRSARRGRSLVTAARRPTLEPTARAAALAETLLDRHGVLTRGAVTAEGAPGGFAAVYRVLSAFEDAGRVRRGYYVEGLGAAQFATTGPVDRLRALDDGPAQTLVVAAADPANPYGAALPWPDRGQSGAALSEPQRSAGQHKPGRKAGALVVLHDGGLVLYVERGGRTLLSFTDDEPQLSAAADALALAVREGALGRLTVERADGAGLLGSGHPMVAALEAAGFHATPRGLRLRR